MNKKVLLSVGIIVVLGIAYYLISPFWNNKELNEESPLTVGSQVVKDDLDNMSPETKERFEQETLAMKDKVMVMSDSVPSNQAKIVASAEFKPRAHAVSGKAILIEQNGKHVVRFENFETINGPDVDVYLSSELGDADYVSLGDLKATQGNVNYTVPEGTDISKYNKVLIWCKAFSVLFSYAEFK
ncbi:MAG: DM13 domain-containing protein [Candidatus Doudnabacteria bacterium]|nr:DM13 domain-containing protein [Candidatus Doudnabacteria bacterium]